MDPFYEGDVLLAIAGDLAKLGTVPDTPSTLHLPKATSCRFVDEYFADIWVHRWRTTPGCRQTKLWIQTPGQINVQVI